MSTATDNEETRVLHEGPVGTGSTGRSTDAGHRAEPPSLPSGTQIGRYRIVERLGAGGMGVVYRALDPELDRDVALKLLRPRARQEQGHTAALRLLREAQAMARLSHPNVVAVHDAGTVERDDEGPVVFVALELVEGETLKDWLRAGERDWRDVLSMFLAAGRGLAAAHAAGIVHRDFKPANVLVGEDGRARVMDFGLARAVGDTLEESSRERQDADGEPSFSEDLTRTGFVMGTPAYMAPEQHAGGRGDPRSDQFGFCVSLWEGLYGARPFPGDTRREVTKAIIRQQPQVPDDTGGVPAVIRRALARGLSYDPEDRHSTMEDLLEALGGAQGRGMRAALLSVAALGFLGVTLWGLSDDGGAEPCPSAQARIDEVFGAEQRTQLGQHFAALSVSFAGDTWERTEPALQDFAEQWVQMHGEACEATRVRGAQSEALLDQRMACLDHRLNRFEELVRELGNTDDQTAARATRSVAALPLVADCADADALASRARLPEDPQLRLRVEELRRDLSKVATKRQMARYVEARALLDDVRARAADIDYAPLVVELETELGMSLSQAKEYEEAEATYKRALWTAEEAGMDREVTQLSGHLIALVGVLLARHDDAATWGRLAEAKLERSGRGTHLEARIQMRLGDLADASSDEAAAVKHYERALELWNELAPGSTNHAQTIANFGKVHYRAGRYKEAYDWFTRGHERLDEVLGPRHPETARALSNAASAAHQLGDYESAMDVLKRALSVFEEVYGPDHPSVAMTHTNLGSVHYRLGRYEDAVANAKRSLAIKEATYGPDHVQCTYPLNNLGMAQLALDQHEQAEATYSRAVDIAERSLGPEHRTLANPLTGLAEVRIQVGRAAEAVEPLERALKIFAANETAPIDDASARWLLARALTDSGGDPERISTLVHEAKTSHDKAEHPVPQLAADIDGWLEEHE